MKFQRDNDTFIKVGKSKDIDSRLQNLNINHQGEILYKFDEEGTNWSTIENIVHKTFIEKVYIPEIQLPSGTSEIYPLSLLPEILNKIENLLSQGIGVISIPDQARRPDILKTMFYKAPVLVCQAETISKIVEGIEVFMPFELEHKSLYYYLLSSFKYDSMFHRDTIAANAYLSVKCGMSLSTVKRRIKDLRDFGVVTYETKRSKAGVNTPCKYTEVVDLVNDNRFKLNNPKLSKFFSDKALKSLYIKDLFSSHPIDKSWTSQQAKFYWMNIHYELMMGVYLQGDKLSGALYDDKVEFKMEDSLKDEDFKLLFELRYNEGIINNEQTRPKLL